MLVTDLLGLKFHFLLLFYNISFIKKFDSHFIQNSFQDASGGAGWVLLQANQDFRRFGEEQEFLQDYYGEQFAFESQLAEAQFREEYPMPYEGVDLSRYGHQLGGLGYMEQEAWRANLPEGVSYNPTTNQFY